MNRFIVVLFALFATINSDPISPSITVGITGIADSTLDSSKPFIDGSKTFVNGEIRDWAASVDEVSSPIIDASTGQRTVIGLSLFCLIFLE